MCIRDRLRRKRKKSNLATRRKFSGRLTKNANVSVVQLIVRRDVLNVKLRSKVSKLRLLGESKF